MVANSSASGNRMSTMTYDAGGNVTYDGSNHYLYDDENRLISVSPIAGGGPYTYQYDAGRA